MTLFKRLFHKTASKVKRDQENGARKAILEDLFYDFNRSRAQVYKMNFIRGLMLGAGTVIGGTLVVALLVWVLSLLANVIPPLGDFFESVSQILQSGKR